MNTYNVILIETFAILFFTAYFCLSLVVMRIRLRRRLKNLINEATNTDGEHHKQWYLHRIADELVIKIDSDDKGIAP